MDDAGNILKAEDGNTLTTATIEYTALDDYSVTACFTEEGQSSVKPIVTSALPESGGNVTASAENAAVGSDIMLTANANAGYRFVQWEKVDGTLISRDSSCTAVVDDAASYVARFKAENSNVVNVARKSNTTITSLSGIGLNSSDRPLSRIVDGNKNIGQYTDFKNADTYKGVQIDLGKVYDSIDKISLYRYTNNTYKGTLIQVSTDAEITNPTTVYYAGENGSFEGIQPTEVIYTETDSGKTIVLPDGVSARYVRLYSMRTNTASSDAHIVELEVYAETADTAELSTLINTYAGENLESNNFTACSWKVYNDALTVAQALVEAASNYIAVNSSEVAQAQENLVNAHNNLSSDTSFAGASLTLEGDIGVNFYTGIKSSDVENAKVKFIVAGRVSEVPAIGKEQTDGTYKFTCKVAAAELTENIKAEVTTQPDG